MTLESKSKWVVKNKVKEGADFDEIIKVLLQNRDIENTDDFLSPELDKVPSHKKLYDSVGAARKIVDAVKKKKKIVIYGDYDVDGITGTAILWSFLYFELVPFFKLGKNEIDIKPYIPDRIEEGYGLSTQSLDKLSKDGVELIVTVDCGIRDKELIEKYKDIEFIVTDHHLPPDDILQDLNYTIVHQMYPKKEYPHVKVCGAFVTYLLMLAIKDVVGLDSSIEKNKDVLDLVALATVADIMPLVEINRILVKNGLEVLKDTNNVGLKKLAEVSKMDLKEVSAYHLGFVLGPRLNAAGRLDLGMETLKLLCTKDESLATELAKKLNSLNFERQNLTFQMLTQAREKVGNEKLIIVIDETWHEGVIGLVASKLQEQFHRPVIVFTKNGEDIKGSARSINGINITEVIGEFSKYLTRFGGHAQAAGLSLNVSNFDKFRDEITKYVDGKYADELFEKVLDIDLALDTSFLNLDFATLLSKLEPFGYGNKKPLFMLEEVVVVSKRVLGSDENHLKLEIKGKSTGVEEAIFFNCSDDIPKINEEDVLDLVGSVGINEWNGLVKIQFEIKEWRYCKKKP